jgi:hypothetical protein
MSLNIHIRGVSLRHSILDYNHHQDRDVVVS